MQFCTRTYSRLRDGLGKSTYVQYAKLAYFLAISGNYGIQKGRAYTSLYGLLCFTSFSLVILNTKDQATCNKI